MKQPKEKRDKLSIKTRTPGKLPRSGMFDRVQLRESGPHPIEEILKTGTAIPDDTTEPHDNLSPDDNLSPHDKIAPPPHDKFSPDDNLSPHDKLSPGDINPAAWTGVPNDVWKKINCKLKPAEQAVLSYLYRMTRGFHRDEYWASKVEIARACMMSDRNVPRITKKLAIKGLIEVLGHDFDNPDFSKRGTHYRMVVPGAAVKAKKGGGDNLSSGENLSPHSNKEEFKETSKRGFSPAAKEIKNCPDCHGTNYFYPEGTEKGVRKCKHERLIKPDGVEV